MRGGGVLAGFADRCVRRLAVAALASSALLPAGAAPGAAPVEELERLLREQDTEGLLWAVEGGGAREDELTGWLRERAQAWQPVPALELARRLKDRDAVQALRWSEWAWPEVRVSWAACGWHESPRAAKLMAHFEARYGDLETLGEREPGALLEALRWVIPAYRSYASKAITRFRARDVTGPEENLGWLCGPDQPLGDRFRLEPFLNMRSARAGELRHQRERAAEKVLAVPPVNPDGLSIRKVPGRHLGAQPLAWLDDERLLFHAWVRDEIPGVRQVRVWNVRTGVVEVPAHVPEGGVNLICLRDGIVGYAALEGSGGEVAYYHGLFGQEVKLPPPPPPPSLDGHGDRSGRVEPVLDPMSCRPWDARHRRLSGPLGFDIPLLPGHGALRHGQVELQLLPEDGGVPLFEMPPPLPERYDLGRLRFVGFDGGYALFPSWAKTSEDQTADADVFRFWPDGRFGVEVYPLGRWFAVFYPEKSVLTRRGLLFARHPLGPRRGHQFVHGLFLAGGGTLAWLLLGDIDGELVVSPDGCRVAASLAPSQTQRRTQLYAIDVCKVGLAAPGGDDPAAGRAGDREAER